MNKCIKCGHESNDDVTDYKSNASVWRELGHWNNFNLPHKHCISHHWYCKLCHHTWFIIDLDDPTWFLEGQEPWFTINTPSDPATEFNFSLPPKGSDLCAVKPAPVSSR